jgi:hypothetical protein
MKSSGSIQQSRQAAPPLLAVAGAVDHPDPD